jgi:type I restriction enzyme S subunit
MSFEQKTLGEVSNFFNNRRKPVTRAKRLGGQYPYYGAAGIQDYVSDFLFDGRYILIGEDGSVLTEANHPVVQIAEGKFWVNNHAHVIQPISEDDFSYLYYSLLNSDVDDLVTGAVQPKLSMSNVKSLIFNWCVSPLIRREVGRTLSQIDEKIEKNREISKTLEEIAQTIFKSWFIDFDPVKAKMAGEKPVGMDDATAALFPDSMEYSELGLIPAGWKVATVGDVLVKQKPGKLYDQKTSMQEGLVPVLDQGRSGVVGYHNDAPGYVATPDSPVVVFANHTCSLRFIAYPFSVIQNVFPILGNDLSVYWLFFALQGKQKFDSYKGHWPDLVIKPVVRPSSILTNAFEKLTSPLMRLVWNIEKENQSLVQVRDSLLPRLISGELQIPEEMLGA